MKHILVVNKQSQEEVSVEQIVTMAERFPNMMKKDAWEQLHLKIHNNRAIKFQRALPVDEAAFDATKF